MERTDPESAGNAYSGVMAPPKRVASRRTAAAIAEDLGQARSVGGLWRADETHLSETVDYLEAVGVSPDETPLARARDLLLSHVSRVCAQYRADNEADQTAQAAASSLETLLSRPATDMQKVETIRRASAPAKHHVSPDAIRHREDRLIDKVAADVLTDLQARRGDEPQTMEAAIHRLAPTVADLRQQLHDGLCLTYQNLTPADPRERRAIEGYYRQVIIKLGDLMVICDQILNLGLKSANMSADDFWFMSRAAQIGHHLFAVGGDRNFMREFLRAETSKLWEECVEHLLATDRGREVYEHWVEWAQACYPTCAFERAFDPNYMCSPHQLVTLLYDTENKYVQLGFSELIVEGNEPMLHHRLGHPEQDET